MSSGHRKAPASPSASSARSRLPVRLSGVRIGSTAKISAVAAAFWVGATPTLRRAPFIAARTPSSSVGSAAPASSCAYLSAARRRPGVEVAQPSSASETLKAATASGLADREWNPIEPQRST